MRSPSVVTPCHRVGLKENRNKCHLSDRRFISLRVQRLVERKHERTIGDHYSQRNKLYHPSVCFLGSIGGFLLILFLSNGTRQRTKNGAT